MDRAFVFVLPFLVVVLMGNSCEFRSGFNGSIAAEETEEGRREGLIIVVTDGDASPEAVGSIEEDSRTVIRAALSVPVPSAYSPNSSNSSNLPDQPGALGDSAGSPDSASFEMPELRAEFPSSREVASAGSVVPEPTGFILFGIGVFLASSFMRRGWSFSASMD